MKLKIIDSHQLLETITDPTKTRQVPRKGDYVMVTEMGREHPIRYQVINVVFDYPNDTINIHVIYP